MSVTKKVPKIADPDFQGDHQTANESWHAFEIMAEFVGATESLKEITPAVSIFGSARTKPKHADYLLAEKFLDKFGINLTELLDAEDAVQIHSSKNNRANFLI